MLRDGALNNTPPKLTLNAEVTGLVRQNVALNAFKGLSGLRA